MENLYDVVIVGGGPAGLSAAIYMARAKYKVLVLEKEKFGGQITITSEIVNYPGVFKTSGSALTEDMQRQAEAFGAEFKLAEVLDMEVEGDYKIIHTTAGDYKTLGIVLAVGANPRKIGFQGEKEFQGRGVAYCATCDGEFFQDMHVYVVGGGFAAVEEGIFLTKYASSITMLVRDDDFSCAKTVSDHVAEEEKITVKFQTEVVSVEGETFLEKIKLRNRETGEIWEESPQQGFGVFVFAGYVPNTDWLPEVIEKDSGYIVTDINKKTNVDGVYAAGDVCIKNLRQVVTAVSDGAIASTSLEKYVEQMHISLDIPPLVQEKKEVAEPIPASTTSGEEESGAFISAEIKAQLAPVFAKFEHKVIIQAALDTSSFSTELKGFLAEFKMMSDKIVVQEIEKEEQEARPYLELVYEDGKKSGIRFCAVPGGHEFNSFIIALYNVAGPGKEIDQSLKARIEGLKVQKDIKVLISLSCTMCPEVVMASQQIASITDKVQATMIDLMHFPDMKEKYKVMSVPCMVIDDEVVYFGKKNINEVVDILEK